MMFLLHETKFVSNSMKNGRENRTMAAKKGGKKGGAKKSSKKH